MKKIVKNKKGGSEIIALILIPVIILIVFSVVLKMNSRTVIKKRVQTALDSALLYVSTYGSIVEVNDSLGNKYEVCSFNDELVQELKLSVTTQIIQTIDGYNDNWSIGFSTATVDDVGNQLFTITISGTVPNGNITDYEKWYKKNTNWNPEQSDVIRFTVSGSTTCR